MKRRGIGNPNHAVPAVETRRRTIFAAELNVVRRTVQRSDGIPRVFAQRPVGDQLRRFGRLNEAGQKDQLGHHPDKRFGASHSQATQVFAGPLV
jgi:hypothetical protein